MLLQPSAFLDRLILFLLPHFLAVTPDVEVARAEIVQTLAAYGTRTRAEMLNAVQIIAFGFSALDVLAEAALMDTPPPVRLRFHGCANALNRSCQQNERMLAKRLACDLPDTAAPPVEPVNDVGEPAVEQTLRQAEATIDACLNRLSGVRPATGPHAMPAWKEEQSQRRPGAAMLAALADTTPPLRPASTA